MLEIVGNGDPREMVAAGLGRNRIRLTSTRSTLRPRLRLGAEVFGDPRRSRQPLHHLGFGHRGTPTCCVGKVVDLRLNSTLPPRECLLKRVAVRRVSFAIETPLPLLVVAPRHRDFLNGGSVPELLIARSFTRFGGDPVRSCPKPCSKACSKPCSGSPGDALNLGRPRPRPAPTSADSVVITVREFLTVPPGRPRPRLRSFQHSSPSPSIGSCPPIACLGPRTPLLAVERSSLRGLWKGPPGGPCDADAGSDSEHSKIPKTPNIPKVDCPARQARCPLRTFDVPETAPTHLRTPPPAARRPSSSLRRWKRRRMTRRESRCLSDPN